MTPPRPTAARFRFPMRFLALSMSALLPVAGHAGPSASHGPVSADLLARLSASDHRLAPFTARGSCESRTVWEELDRHGKVKSRSEFVSRVQYSSGEMRTDVLHATRDGKDVTAEERAKRTKEKARKKESSGRRQVRLSFDSPFSPSRQPLYRFRLLGPDPSGPDRIRIAYSPAGEPTVDVSVGEAIVDAKDGRLIRLSGHPSKLPWFVDKMQVALEYQAPTNLGSMLSKIEGEGEGGFLFIRKRMRMSGTFTDWKTEGTDSATGAAGP